MASKIKVTKIGVKIKNREVMLSPEEANELRAVLNDPFLTQKPTKEPAGFKHET